MLVSILMVALFATPSQSSYVPKEGFVPDKATAIRMAEAVLIPIYGEAHIIHERPFKAMLKDSVWYVKGTLPKHFLGGVAMVRLSKHDGRILYVMHGK